MLSGSVTFRYGERCYTFVQDLDQVIKGKLGCDCSRSQLIREYCDPDFPVLACGQKIETVSVVELPPEALASASRSGLRLS